MYEMERAVYVNGVFYRDEEKAEIALNLMNNLDNTINEFIDVFVREFKKELTLLHIDKNELAIRGQEMVGHMCIYIKEKDLSSDMLRFVSSCKDYDSTDSDNFFQENPIKDFLYDTVKTINYDSRSIFGHTIKRITKSRGFSNEINCLKIVVHFNNHLPFTEESINNMITPDYWNEENAERYIKNNINLIKEALMYKGWE